MIWHESRRHDSGHSWLREIVQVVLGRLGNAEQHGRKRDVVDVTARRRTRKSD